MYGNIIIHLLMVLLGSWDPSGWVKSETAPGDCPHIFTTLRDPNYILDASNFDSSTMLVPYNEAILKYKEILCNRFGRRITEDLIFGEKWREKMSDSCKPSIGGFFSFSANPDFLLFWTVGCQPEPFSKSGGRINGKIAYLSSLDTTFRLSHYESKGINNIKLDIKLDRTALFKDFNFWIDNSKDLRNMRPECLAAILLHILYREEIIYFVQSADDVVIARALEKARNSVYVYGDSIPQYLFDILFMDPKDAKEGNPALNPYIKDQHKADSLYGTMDNYEGYNYHEPIISSDDFGTSLILTVYTDDELADWKIIFDSNNHLISMEYVAPPILGLPSDTIHSPYYLDKP